MTYTNKKGEKLYPVCFWAANQHKLYNAHDRLMNAIDECREERNYDELDKLENSLDRLERAMNVFDQYVIEGLVYATYEDGMIIKDFVWAYNARH